MVRAPFELHKVPVGRASGQAAGEQWFILPYRLRRFRLLSGKIERSFGYCHAYRQYIGGMLFHAGKEVWRRL